MPTYDFKCKKCDNVFEHFYTIAEYEDWDSAKDNITHTNIVGNEDADCDGTVERHYSFAPPVHYKGPGFYVNDNPTEKNKKDRMKYLSDD